MSLLLRRAPYKPYMSDQWREKMDRIRECVHCDACKGRGYTVNIQRMGNMISQSQSPCSKCRGQGKTINPSLRCKKCNGNKVVNEF